MVSSFAHVPRCATIFKMMEVIAGSSHDNMIHCHSEEDSHTKPSFFSDFVKEQPKCICKTFNLYKFTAETTVRSHVVDLIINPKTKIMVLTPLKPKSISRTIDPPPPRLV